MLRKENIRVKIAKRAAAELHNGEIVNLGVGIPTLIPDFLGDKKVYLHSENGLLGIGPTPPEDERDMNLISASKEPITMDLGASLFDSSISFNMIRGGHIDVAIMGALQIDQTGEVANWAVPEGTILGVGGAMDLMAGAKKIIIASTHLAKNGKSKLVKKLTYPSSSKRKVEMVITEHGVFEFHDGKMILTEMTSNLSIEQLKEITEAEFDLSDKLKLD
ncbi:3-oxoacid CoA-transferase subunit B [Bacillus aquiflavi]|uniref:3-oxoacid CoA-transferase subunit B n=1 Tax=Bacillus aquiflavi TaxID=2672567 RepID=A0A6B3W0R7_9BACI|nr:3-oxoacid CoA-transferase subunit B [Bacillus aquiflavi]MBA4536797.1 3-oxoacid CoA-transferase subunit B [Bacillus aquiflavi]NEY81164.1 3-oxoacid CoA-transferase subunit B [Bacillus aquiflavi]UAC49725.1 3-oxoacid CoA-transferase subunit B [Bacillus aquiflavi]